MIRRSTFSAPTATASLLALATLITLFTSAKPEAADAATPAPRVLIEQAWIRTPPGSAPTAAAYARLTNTGSRPDRLIGASAPGAEEVVAHTMSMAGGVMSMRPASSGLELAPGRAVVLAPGAGAHLMIIRPRRRLRQGMRMAVTLRFERAGPETAFFTVAGTPPAPRGR